MLTTSIKYERWGRKERKERQKGKERKGDQRNERKKKVSMEEKKTGWGKSLGLDLDLES